MVDIKGYKIFIKWLHNHPENEKFTVSDVCRANVIAPTTVDNIIKDLLNSESPYLEMKGEGKNKYYLKLRNVDIDFFSEKTN